VAPRMTDLDCANGTTTVGQTDVMMLDTHAHDRRRGDYRARKVPDTDRTERSEFQPRSHLHSIKPGGRVQLSTSAKETDLSMRQMWGDFCHLP
jgi:hypothetical protein